MIDMRKKTWFEKHEGAVSVALGLLFAAGFFMFSVLAAIAIDAVEATPVEVSDVQTKR